MTARITVSPGYTPDCKEFTAPECLSVHPVALGSLAAHGTENDTGLAGAIKRIGGDKVHGVKVEDRAVLVLVRDPSDWPTVEPEILALIGRALHDSDDEEVLMDEDGIRIVLDNDEKSLRHFDCPESMRQGAFKGIASAGMLHDPDEHGTSLLAQEIHRISFVRGVLIDGNRVSVAIKDADQWVAAQHYILQELKGALDGTLDRELARRHLCPACRDEERTGPVGTASMHRTCTCEPDGSALPNVRNVYAHASAEEIRIQMLADEQAEKAWKNGKGRCVYTVRMNIDALALMKRYCAVRGIPRPELSNLSVTPQQLLDILMGQSD